MSTFTVNAAPTTLNSWVGYATLGASVAFDLSDVGAFGSIDPADATLSGAAVVAVASYQNFYVVIVLAGTVPDAVFSVTFAGQTLNSSDATVETIESNGFYFTRFLYNWSGSAPLSEGESVDVTDLAAPTTPTLGTQVVPNVVGMTLAAAALTLTAAGFQAGTAQSTYSSVPAGDILTQSPAAGTAAAPGTFVLFVVSAGPPPVPNITGLALLVGQSYLISAGFVVGAVTGVASDQPNGTIVSYSPSGSVAPGATIAIQVSGLLRSGFGAAYAQRITSEHNQRPNFMALVGVYTDAMAEIIAGMSAVTAAFDLDLAVGAQLDVIGLWAGQSRVIPSALSAGYFGFSDDLAALPFGELTDPSKGGKWYELGTGSTFSSTLNDAEYRAFIRARIVRNQSRTTLADLETALFDIFGVPCTVIDNGTKNLAITVSQPITPTGQELLSALDVLPRAAGVKIGSLTFTT